MKIDRKHFTNLTYITDTKSQIKMLGFCHSLKTGRIFSRGTLRNVTDALVSISPSAVEGTLAINTLIGVPSEEVPLCLSKVGREGSATV